MNRQEVINLMQTINHFSLVYDQTSQNGNSTIGFVTGNCHGFLLEFTFDENNEVVDIDISD
jgi:hypothetical protein